MFCKRAIAFQGDGLPDYHFPVADNVDACGQGFDLGFGCVAEHEGAGYGVDVGVCINVAGAY